MEMDGVIQSHTALLEFGINWEGQRQVLGVELANCESHSSWREFALKQRGRSGVELAVSDDCARRSQRSCPRRHQVLANSSAMLSLICPSRIQTHGGCHRTVP